MGDLYFDFYEIKQEEKKVKNAVFAALDFETTGLYPQDDRVVEVGIEKFNLNGTIESYGTLINPGREIPPESSRISGITGAMVKESPGMADVYNKIMDMLDGCLIVAHNINFDYQFLKKEAERLGYSYELSIGIDTIALARKALKGHRSYSLQNLAKDLNLPVENAHRALDDARLCRDVFRTALGAIENSPEMLLKDLFLFSNTRIK